MKKFNLGCLGILVIGTLSWALIVISLLLIGFAFGFISGW